MRPLRVARAAVLLGLLAALGLNGLAWMHVRAMTHFVEAGERTARPEELGLVDKARVLLFGVSLPRPRHSHDPGEHGWTYDTHRIPVDDGHVEVWSVPPEGPVRGDVLLFHGYGGARDTMLPVAAHLREQGWATVLVDFRGSGGSSGNTVTLGHREARDVRAVADWARGRNPGRRQVLYGFSMGGAAVLKALADGTNADAAVVEAVYDDLNTTIGHRFHRLGLPAFPGSELLLVWGSVDLGANAFAMRPVDWAAGTDVPLVVIAGAEDPRVWPAEAQAVADAAEAPFTLLEGVGHELGAVAAPEAWAAALAPVLGAR
ncbi:MAG: alpha/beta fold hydrolase [Myxococcota bacterium]